MLRSGSSLLSLVWRRPSSHVSTAFSEAAKLEKPAARGRAVEGGRRSDDRKRRSAGEGSVRPKGLGWEIRYRKQRRIVRGSNSRTQIARWRSSGAVPRLYVMRSAI